MSRRKKQAANTGSVLDSQGLDKPREVTRLEPVKKEALVTSEAYMPFDPDKGRRIRFCGTKIVYEKLENGSCKLVSANFCHCRFCQMCQQRRSKKLGYQVGEILNYLEVGKKYKAIMMVLTVKNCRGDELKSRIDAMVRAWDRLRKYPEFNMRRKGSFVLGYMRSIEVTHNVDVNSNSYDTYHPHIHALFIVAKDYFSKNNPYYCTFERLQEIWSQAAKLDYSPNVYINAVKSSGRRSLEKSIREVCKYSVKSNDYIIPEKWTFTVETLKILDSQLAGRRFVSFGGIIREAHRALHLDDPDTGDLVNLDGKEHEVNEANLLRFYWSFGYNQYRRD